MTMLDQSSLRIHETNQEIGSSYHFNCLLVGVSSDESGVS